MKKSRLGQGFFVFALLVMAGAADFFATHLMLPSGKLTNEMTEAVYRTLITKWFLAGLVLGMLLMFLFVESWVWRNWQSWNKFCCDHHERVYRATMGLHKI